MFADIFYCRTKHIEGWALLGKCCMHRKSSSVCRKHEARHQKRQTNLSGISSKTLIFKYSYVVIFLRITVQLRRSQHACTLTPMNTHRQTLPRYEHIQRTEPTHLEIDEVTTGTTLSTGSPTTESIGINLGNYKHCAKLRTWTPTTKSVGINIGKCEPRAKSRTWT